MKSILTLWIAFSALLAADTLTFEKTLQEIDAPADAKVVTADFKFTNKSKKTVAIEKYESTCSCMTVQVSGGKLRYEPGESGVVRAKFDMGNFSGDVDKVVAIWLEGDKPAEPSLRLTTRVHIPVLVSIDPKTVKWQVNGEPTPQVVKITMNHDKPIHISAVTGSNENFTSKLETVEEGKSYKLVVTPVDATEPGLGIFRIETDCELERHRIQQAFAVISKPSPGAAAAR